MASERKRPVISDGLPSQLPDIDPEETNEWVESLDGVIDTAGAKRARYIMLRLLERARERQVGVPPLTTTDYINTIPPEREPWFPGDEHVERRIRAYIRWNAAMLVHRAQRPEIGVGGHISTYASAASLYEVGYNHFFRGRNHPGGGDHVFFQGHASPGMYARAYLEGRLTETQLDGFRQELSGPRRWPAQLPAPAAHAGLLGVPDGVDGPRRHQRHPAGPVQPLPAPSGHQGHQRPARLGLPRRRRDGRAGDAGRDRHRRPRGARQPDLRDQLQPAAARRPGARQRQGDPGAGGVLPRRRLERRQGHLGPRVGPAAGRRHRRRAGEPDEHHPGRRLPDVQGRVGRVRPRALLRPRPAHPQDGRVDVRRRDLEPQAGRPRLPQGLRGVPGGGRAHRAADGDPGQDHQGLDARLALRGPQRHPPDEEAHPGRPEGVPRPALPGDPGQGAGGQPVPAAVLPPRAEEPGDGVPARAAEASRRVRTVARARPPSP